jgi:hypothetical protein
MLSIPSKEFKTKGFLKELVTLWKKQKTSLKVLL